MTFKRIFDSFRYLEQVKFRYKIIVWDKNRSDKLKILDQDWINYPTIFETIVNRYGLQ